MAAHPPSVNASINGLRLNQPSALSFSRRARNALVWAVTSGTPCGMSASLAGGRRFSIAWASSEWNACITSVASALLYTSIQCEPAGWAFRQPVRSTQRSSMRTMRRSLARGFCTISQSSAAASSSAHSQSHSSGVLSQSTTGALSSRKSGREPGTCRSALDKRARFDLGTPGARIESWYAEVPASPARTRLNRVARIVQKKNDCRLLNSPSTSLTQTLV
mmetsp:Transcript_47850/g.108581  ORF Transcript_47850/g.108581 Transcript_47850/m.108581 type:complete len:220 (-) Transcript_47850:29-688(-)